MKSLLLILALGMLVSTNVQASPISDLQHQYFYAVPHLWPIHRGDVNMDRLGTVHPEAMCSQYRSCY